MPGKRIHLSLTFPNYRTLVDYAASYSRSASSVVSFLIVAMCKRLAKEDAITTVIYPEGEDDREPVDTSLSIKGAAIDRLNELVLDPKFQIKLGDSIKTKDKTSVINAIVIFYRGQFNTQSFIDYAMTITHENKNSSYFLWQSRNQKRQADILKRVQNANKR